MKTLPYLLFILSQIIVFFVSSDLLAQNQTARQTDLGNIWYWEYLPPGYNTNTDSYPLLVFLHGIGERGPADGSQLNRVLRNGPPDQIRDGNDFPFIVVSPQLVDFRGNWRPQDVDRVIEHAKNVYRVDENRIYLTGLSLGGGGVWGYLQNFPQKIAAAAPIAGSGNTPSLACVIADENIPIWVFHGDNDRTINRNISIRMVNAINACDPPIDPQVRLTLYPGVGHNSWDRAYRLDNSLHDPNLYEWLEMQSMSAISVDAGSDQTVILPQNTIGITGNASSSGAITSYLWEKVSGPTATLVNENTSILTLNSLIEGIYIFRLTVEDDGGGSASDEVQITVLASNQPPNASAGPDRQIKLPTNSLSLSGSGSDPDGTITSYQWSQILGGSANLSGDNTPNLNLSNLEVGSYTFELVVFDDDGASASDEVIVTVLEADNLAPSADAGVDQQINLPTNSVNLIGSGSDSDGSVDNYLWEKTSGPTATLTNTDLPTLSVSNMVQGVYTFSLTVTDNDGDSDSDEVQVTVVAANQSPNVDAGPDRQIKLPTNSLSLSGTGSDPDGTVASYQWSQVLGGNADLSGANTPNLALSNLEVGSYTFELVVFDNDGASASDEVIVTVLEADNLAPSADAGVDQQINLPTNSINLIGSGSDSDGSVDNYLWEKTSGPTATLINTDLPTLSVSNMVQGVYTFSLTVTDNDGDSDSDEVRVTVVAANQSPAADAGPNVFITLPTSSTTLIGSGSDPDGIISNFLWEQLNGPVISSISNPNLSTTTITNLTTEGVYLFNLIVTDNDGATNNDEVTVTVGPQPNVPPVVSAGDDIFISLPTNNVTINGTANDPDGSIVSFNWVKLSGPTSTLSNENTSMLTASNLVAGSYTFELRVVDNLGAESSDQVLITVSPEEVNESPTANAGSDISITLPVNSTTLAGSGIDPDGTIVSFDWDQIFGPTPATLSQENTENLVVNDLVEGTYRFEFTVTDDDGAIDTDVSQVTVNAANIPPNVNAGVNRVLTLPTSSIILNGIASDIDGSISLIFWEQINGPNIATLSDDNTLNLSVSGLIAGVYTFRLNASDNTGAISADEVNVTVNEPANQSPIVNAGPDLSVTLPNNSINISGTANDSDGSIVTILWEQNDGPSIATLINEDNLTLTANDLTEGEYIFRISVFDDDGATDFDDVRVVVNPEAINEFPTVNAGPNRTIVLPTNSIIINSTASDPDGTIESFLWSKSGGPPSTLSNINTASLTVSNMVEGNYSFRIRVTDDEGGQAEDEVIVTVQPQMVNQSPVTNAGDDISITLPTNSVTIFGAASDPDGSIASYLWEQTAGPAATLL
ncbi:MAG: dienelactone hydrolase family protein, partial [Bacteroidota bacterium]